MCVKEEKGRKRTSWTRNKEKKRQKTKKTKNKIRRFDRLERVVEYWKVVEREEKKKKRCRSAGVVGCCLKEGHKCKSMAEASFFRN